MNLKELDSFKISDAITFHDKLNPKLFSGSKLRPEVSSQLKLIAQDFLEELGINNLDVVDMTISGSNAAYSYTPHSDLDLHILVDMGNLPNDDVYKELFNAKKNIYNDSHDIKIHGVPVELYVQDAREPVISLGEYSINKDEWLRLPTKRRANFDQTATKSKYEKLLGLIELGLQSDDIGRVSNILKKIRQYRQAGLDKGGEFGPENLAYKALRSQGLITKLYNLRDRLHDEILTIETMYQDPVKIQEEQHQLPKKVYHLTYSKNLPSIMQAGLRPQIGSRSSQIENEQSAVFCFPNMQSLEDAMMNWLGDELDEEEPLALLEINTKNLAGDFTPNAEYEVAITSMVPPSHIKILSKDFDTIDEDYDPNGVPPGPEFKPTMPAGTVRVDVSDVYDWYKLGQHISNLKGLGHHDFGKGPPSTIFSFGSEDEEHKYIDALKKTGLTTTDIDPVDPNQPKGMPRQKTDPTYNVNETSDDETIRNYHKLNKILTKLCEMVVKGQHSTKDYGMVAACVLDPDNNIVAGLNRPGTNGKRVHAERVAIEKYENKYGSVPKGSIVITTLSPCNESDDETAADRVGESCTDYINSKGIKKVYCGYMDPTQDNDNREFNILETGDKSIREECKKFADTFLKQEVGENELQYGVEKISVVSPYAGIKDNQFRGGIAEASGYIPSEKEKNDPRFKTALTVDVKPDSIKKNAKAFNMYTTRAGIPPTAKPNGKF